MKVQNFPDIDLPTVTVTASLPGAAPAQLETEVARKIENSIATLQGVKHIYTKVQDGVVDDHRRIPARESRSQEAVDDVRAAVARVRADLPADLRDPIVTKVDLAGAPVLAFTHRLGSAHGRRGAVAGSSTTTVAQALLAVPGVGAVNRVGGVNREIRVALDPARLQALGVTAADISRQLRQVQQRSAGRPRRRRRRRAVGAHARHRADGATSSAAHGHRRCRDGRRIRLDQVATVTDTVAEPRSAALLDGKPVVGFEVVAQHAATAKSTSADGVRAALDELQGAAPATSRSRRPSTSSTPVQENYDGSLELLYEGALLAVLVVWLFLRDWRATLVSARRAAAVGDPGLPRHVPARLHAQHRHAAGAVAGGRHPGGRRDRRGREHRAPPAHGQDAVCRRRWKRPTRSAWR